MASQRPLTHSQRLPMLQRLACSGTVLGALLAAATVHGQTQPSGSSATQQQLQQQQLQLRQQQLQEQQQQRQQQLQQQLQQRQQQSQQQQLQQQQRQQQLQQQQQQRQQQLQQQQQQRQQSLQQQQQQRQQQLLQRQQQQQQRQTAGRGVTTGQSGATQASNASAATRTGSGYTAAPAQGRAANSGTAATGRGVTNGQSGTAQPSNASAATRTGSAYTAAPAQGRAANSAMTAPPRTSAADSRAGAAGGGTRDAGNGIRVANLNTSQGPAGPPVPSRTFLGHPGPAGSREVQARNGNIVRTAADGSVMDVRSPRNGMSIHHGLDGTRRISVDRPDHSRIVAASRGTQYVQHPYTFRGNTYDHRTFYSQGRTTQQFYRPYNYAGTNMDVYAPSRYYSPEFYQWATTRFNAPVRYNWGYTSSPMPWFGYYKGYFTPEQSYPSPESWLADFVLAASLSSAYSAEQPKSQAPAAGAAAITPEVKQKVADEVRRQVHQESAEARQNSQNKEPGPGSGSVVEELGDHEHHTYVVASDLDLVDPSGRRCMISEGDVVEVVSQAKSGTSTADAIVLASKGGVECERSARVEIALNDLQEMQNHMRATIDQGMASTDRGKQAQTVTPAFATSAPPPDPNAAREIDQEQQIAAAAEG